MKIYKIAQFEDEGHSSEELPNADIQESKILEDQKNKDLSEGKGMHYSSEMLHKILSSGIGNKVKEPWFTATGSVGWLEDNGIVYEIAISPARYGNYYSIYNSPNNIPSNEDTLGFLDS